VNWLKSGPELKMPEWKVPPLLVDLYWDLRDRHLLPLVGLVIVAIVAAPFLLGGGSDESASPAPTAGVSSASSDSQAATLTVVEAKPGLREYSKRLDHRRPTDPFTQRYTTPPPSQSGPELGSETPATTPSSSTSTSTGGSSEATPIPSPSGSGSASPSDESQSSEGGADAGHLTLFAFAVDVKITRTEGGDEGSQPKSEVSTRHRVMPTTPLPGEKAPVVTYMGVGKGAKNALLMVSSNVESIFGDAKCLSGTDACQLLEVEPGMPETFIYGNNHVRYKVNVLKVEAVPAGQPESGQ
jgi:hypothetical protein